MEKAGCGVIWERVQRPVFTEDFLFLRIVLNCRIGTYLGIDVAIKEVLPSTEYDVAKYFEREWRLMKYVTTFRN